jgi:glycolate oxidase FAD binding subunit
MIEPDSPRQLAEALQDCAAAKRVIHLGGFFSKPYAGGPLPQAEVTISTRRLNRILQYEPADLTISVEAGLPWRELARILAEHRQMIPLDPPFFDQSSVGGVVACNLSGPRRKLYGGVRDQIIGMRFTTLEGKIVESGGMVVKNVAGLDMGKLMIGSFGTLAAIAVVNFRLHPVPPYTRTFIKRFASAEETAIERRRLLSSVLQPMAVDVVNPPAAERLGLQGWNLLVEAGGNAAVIERYSRELIGYETADEDIWRHVRDFIPDFLREHPDGAVVRLPLLSTNLESTMAALPVPVLARGGAFLAYACFANARQAAPRDNGVIEFASPESKSAGLQQWPAPGGDFAIMRSIKELFDPHGLLNPGRLFGRI